MHTNIPFPYQNVRLSKNELGFITEIQQQPFIETLLSTTVPPPLTKVSTSNI